VAYSGGPGGVRHDPTPEDRMAEHEEHVAPTKFQQQHIEGAKADKTSYAKNNGGHPARTVAEKPLAAEPHPAPTEPKNEMKPAPKPVANPVPGAGTKAEPKNTMMMAPKNEMKPAPKPEAKPAPKNTMMMAPRSEMRPAPKPEVRPAPHPAPAAHPAPAPHPAPASKPEPKPKK